MPNAPPNEKNVEIELKEAIGEKKAEISQTLNDFSVKYKRRKCLLWTFVLIFSGRLQYKNYKVFPLRF